MILSNFKKRLITSIFLLCLIFLIFNYNFILAYTLIVTGVLSVIEFSQITKKIKSSKNFLFFLNILFIIYIFIFCSVFFIFSQYLQLKIILFLLLLICIASDIGGFIFGKTFKGPKITKISPNKTFSGAFGSIFLSLIVIVSLFFYLDLQINSIVITTIIVTSIFCQIGDLFFSFLKRKGNLQDTGNILPGHGGILDRIDGMLIGIPGGLIFYIFLF